MDFFQVSAKLEKAGRMECRCSHELISSKDVRSQQESTSERQAGKCMDTEKKLED